MAFVPEDGTGVPEANSYVDVDFADAYFADRNVTTWPVAGQQVAAKQGWLISATDYAEGRFGQRWIGLPKTSEQGLHFPIEGEDEVPLELRKAICEYAIRARTAPLAPDPVIDASGFSMVTTRKKVGPIEKSFAIANGDSANMFGFRPYPAADMLIAGLLIPIGNRVIR